MRLLFFALALLLTGVSAQAQSESGFSSLAFDGGIGVNGNATTFFDPNVSRPASGYILTNLPSQRGTDIAFSSPSFFQSAISLDQFASTQQLQDVRSRQDQLAFFMRRDFDRLSQGIALASALTIMPPNPGDRFAFTVSGAGFDGRGAGAISGTYRVREDILVFGGYARSETQNLVKGGATFSFR